MEITILQPQIILELGHRSNQEDSVYPNIGNATIDNRLFILCDGMGGHENGEIASRLVCEVLSEDIHKLWDRGVFKDDILQHALVQVGRRIDQYDSDSFRKMGTTMTLLCLHQNGATMAHIGDSRIYHIRPSEHRILYKSRDHSVAFDLFLAGEIGIDELDTYKKNLITRAIMPGQDGKYNVDIVHTTDIEPGDYFILCSDGMLEQMKDQQLLTMFQSGLPDVQIREQLISQTIDNRDNHSAIFFQIKSVIPEHSDGQAPNEEQSSNSNALIWENRNHNIASSSVDKVIDFESIQKQYPTTISWYLIPLLMAIGGAFALIMIFSIIYMLWTKNICSL